MDFAVKCIRSWSDFTECVSKLPAHWAYRGQSEDWPLKTSLERALKDWDIDLSLAPGIEQQLVREFRRQYRGDDCRLVNDDTLYCLTLMQHHGAPTRLLDCTYSPFVAAKFAIEAGAKTPVIWAINTGWCYKAAEKVVGTSSVAARNIDKSRNDSSFVPLYMDAESSKRFALADGSLDLSSARLVAQQGLFMCPGDAGATFVDNLKAMDGWDSSSNIIKLLVKLNRPELVKVFIMLRKMNVFSAVLFPGLDGFARSLRDSIPLYEDFARRKIGQPGHSTESTI